MSDKIAVKRPEDIMEQMERRCTDPLQGENGHLARVLFERATCTWEQRRQRQEAVYACLEKVCGTHPLKLTRLDDFLSETLKEALILLFGQEEADLLFDLFRLRFSCLPSETIFRRSFHSSAVGDYVQGVFLPVIYRWVYGTGYPITVMDCLTRSDLEIPQGFDLADRLALCLSRGDQAVFEALEQVASGDNKGALLSKEMIQGAIRSGHQPSIQLMRRLLLAAKNQEGLRQQILESADEGSQEVFIEFLELILSERLFRFSSVIGAFNTWSGMGYGEDDPALVEKCLGIALDYLRHPQNCNEGVKSDNVILAYFALWSMAVWDISQVRPLLESMLQSELKYKKLLAIYFINRVEHNYLPYELAVEQFTSEDPEILAWLASNLRSCHLPYYGLKQAAMESVNPRPDEGLPKRLEDRQRQFAILDDALMRIGKKDREFSGSLFPWTCQRLSAIPVVNCMMNLALYDLNREMICTLCRRLDFFSAEQRGLFYIYLLNPDSYQEDRRFLLEHLNDRRQDNREAILCRLSTKPLATDELPFIHKLLAGKNGAVRQKVIQLLLTQENEILTLSLDTLLRASSQEQLQSGLELLVRTREDRKALFQSFLPQVYGLAERGKITAQTRILLNQLTEDADDPEKLLTPEQGYGLFDLSSNPFLPETWRTEPDLFSRQEVEAFLAEAEKATLTAYSNIIHVFHENSAYEYEGYTSNGKDMVLLGNVGSNISLSVCGNLSAWECSRLPFDEKIPLAELFRKAAGTLNGDVCLLAIALWFVDDRRLFGRTPVSWFEECMAGLLPGSRVDGRDAIRESIGKPGDFMGATTSILQALLEDCLRDPQEKRRLFRFAFRMYDTLLYHIPQQKWCGEWTVGSRYYSSQARMAIDSSLILYWRSLSMQCAQSEKDFSEYFCELYYEYLSVERKTTCGLGLPQYLRAASLGIIGDTVLYEELLYGPQASDNIRALTRQDRYQNHCHELYPPIKDICRIAVETILKVEVTRGQLPTPLSRLAISITRVEGAEWFVRILAALGDDTFQRGYRCSFELLKKDVLCYLLRHSYPAEGENENALRQYLSSTDIPQQRLVEAAMYAPQWASLTEQVLGWEGFRSGIWFFHAHINEQFSAEKETEIALYSPITPQQFNDGAFDRSWFFKAYGLLGEDHFQQLYQAAKYITTGSNLHRRSQLYVDAVLGRLDSDQLAAEIVTKRNQEKLRCYPLIPLNPRKPYDALYRYEFIQKFAQGSRTYGAQRRESEGIACQAALENLAQTTGFFNVDRMVWHLETEKLQEMQPLFEEISVGDVTLQLQILQDGTPEILVRKSGKKQKGIPKALAKSPEVTTLKEAVKSLREQRVRAVRALEKAMIWESTFSGMELIQLLRHPVLAPLISSLIWRDEKGDETLPHFGLLAGEGIQGISLMDDSGRSHPVNPEKNYIIAHPHHLFMAGCWDSFQQLLFQRQIAQPFHQVFREYYPLAEDERGSLVSRRYAGNQVQPKKAIALLRHCGWTVDYEEGLQKVLYGKNLVARLFAAADWFSPSDVETPTLDTLRFLSRDTLHAVELDEVPPIAFSEVMRDVDLAVSVAHVGDPQTDRVTWPVWRGVFPEKSPVGVDKIWGIDYNFS